MSRLVHKRKSMMVTDKPIDFSNQRLYRNNYRDKDLSKAIFFQSQIYGCDFRGANLSGAIFDEAVFRETIHSRIYKIFSEFILGVVACLLIAGGSFITLALTIEIPKWVKRIHVNGRVNAIISEILGGSTASANVFSVGWRENEIILLPLVLIAATVLVGWSIGSTRHAIRKKSLYPIFWYAITIPSLLFVLALTLGGNVDLEVFVSYLGILLGVLLISILLNISLVIAILGQKGSLAAFAVGLLASVVGVIVSDSRDLSMIAVLAVFYAFVVYTSVFAQHIRNKALYLEDPSLQWIRRPIISWLTSGGTRFDQALLANASFEGADVKNCVFSGAKLFRTHFGDARNLSLADTADTCLAPQVVRRLVVREYDGHSKFSGLDLGGVSLRGFHLVNIDLSNSDMSGSDLTGADLRESNLSAVKLFGACIDGANLSGCTIENWGVNSETIFGDVLCDYVYLHSERRMRSPSLGYFGRSDFKKLHEAFIETVDLLAHTPEELQVILQSLKQLREEGVAVAVAGIQRKGDSVRVSLSSPSDIDIEEIANRIYEKFTSQIETIAAKEEVKLLRSDLDAKSREHERDINRMLEYQRQQQSVMDRLLHDFMEIERITVVNNFSRSISNSIIHGSNISLGDNSPIDRVNIDSRITAAMPTLSELESIIERSRAPEAAKNEAKEAIKSITSSDSMPESARKKVMQRAIDSLSEFQRSMTGIADLGERYGELVGRIAIQLGLG